MHRDFAILLYNILKDRELMILIVMMKKLNKL